MSESLFDLLVWVGFGIGMAFGIFCFVMGIRQYVQAKAKQKAEPTVEEFPEPEVITITQKVTVVDQYCRVRSVGIKMPKTIREFAVIFQTENEERLTLPVPEEVYDAFEQGQVGLLTTVDGELYSFELEEMSSQ